METMKLEHEMCIVRNDVSDKTVAYLMFVCDKHRKVHKLISYRVSRGDSHMAIYLHSNDFFFKRVFSNVNFTLV